MSGAATIDLSHPRAASIATGLTMSLGATGAIFSGAGIGLLKDYAKGDWSLVFWVLAGLSVVSALLMVSIWNARPRGRNNMMLSGKGWSERARAGLARLIESGAGKGHAAVFDFDNTIVCGDIGEATLALLAKEKLIKKDDIPAELAPSFRSPAGETVSLSTCRTSPYIMRASGRHGPSGR